MWRVPPDVSGSRHFPVEVRLVRSHDEFAACEAMSRDIWGAAERNVVPRELLLTIQLNGGLVHGAFFPDGRLVGFCFAFAGIREGQLRLCSHQLGVVPELRGGGIGIALKEAQRADALRLGYELVSWTFDPLEARNAYINLHRLGCVARLYDRDHYGAMEDELNRGVPSDRFEAEWWLQATRPGNIDTDVPLALAIGSDGGPERRAVALSGATAAMIQIQSDFQPDKRDDPELARRCRSQRRPVLQAALDSAINPDDLLR